jgi:hypothetical protein
VIEEDDKVTNVTTKKLMSGEFIINSPSVLELDNGNVASQIGLLNKSVNIK